jgi:hypothetical protein
MAILPEIKGLARKKPVCYEPQKDCFITIDDLDAGKAKIVPLDRLTDEQLKRLVIERNRVGEDYRVQNDWAAPPQSRDDVIKQIQADTESGRRAVQAEIMYLRDHLRDIEDALVRSGREREAGPERS